MGNITICYMNADETDTDADLSMPQGRLRHARKLRGYKTAQEFSDTHGILQPTYSNHETGKRGLKRSTAIEYCRLLRINLNWLLAGDGPMAGAPQTSEEAVEVVGHVQAGDWQQAAQWEVDERYQEYVRPSAKYSGFTRFGLEIRGNSMNQYYPDGSVIYCVRFFDLGRVPASGERVVVNREGPAGVEATVKEFIVDEDGTAYLWPRSTNPAHQSPYKLILNNHESNSEDDWGNLLSSLAAAKVGTDEIDEFEIFALVIGHYADD